MPKTPERDYTPVEASGQLSFDKAERTGDGALMPTPQPPDFIEPKGVPLGIEGDAATEMDRIDKQGFANNVIARRRVLPKDEVEKLEGGQEPSIFRQSRGTISPDKNSLGSDQKMRADQAPTRVLKDLRGE